MRRREREREKERQKGRKGESKKDRKGEENCECFFIHVIHIHTLENVFKVFESEKRVRHKKIKMEVERKGVREEKEVERN